METGNAWAIQPLRHSHPQQADRCRDIRAVRHPQGCGCARGVQSQLRHIYSAQCWPGPCKRCGVIVMQSVTSTTRIAPMHDPIPCRTCTVQGTRPSVHLTPVSPVFRRPSERIRAFCSGAPDDSGRRLAVCALIFGGRYRGRCALRAARPYTSDCTAQQTASTSRLHTPYNSRMRPALSVYRYSDQSRPRQPFTRQRRQVHARAAAG